MKLIQEAVTGAEELFNGNTPAAALAQFYRALNTRDFTLMKKNWNSSGEAVMDNPLGGIKRGWQEIGAVYQRLFSSEVNSGLNSTTTQYCIIARSSSRSAANEAG